METLTLSQKPPKRATSERGSPQITQIINNLLNLWINTRIWFLLSLFAGMVGGFEMGTDFVESEP